MKLIRNAILLGLVVGATSMAACSSNSSSAGAGGAPGSNGSITGAAAGGQNGTVGLALQIGGGITVGTVNYVITNPTLAGFSSITGSIDVSGSDTISLSLTLPVATGYTVSLSAIDSNGDGCSGGPVLFDVVAGQTTSVGLSLVCTQIVDGGLLEPDVNVGQVAIVADASLQTEGGATPCAAATGIGASPIETNVGSAISLTASGVDPSMQSSDVTLTWSGSGSAGSLTGTTGASNTFNCTAPGTETITVTASISDGGISCPGIGSLSTSVTCDAPDAGTGAPDAGVDLGAPDTGIDTGAADTGVDTGTPDTGVDTGTPDAGVDAGPLVPCTSAGQTNCVQCQGNTSNLCTPTEAVIVQFDITQGKVTAPGPDSNGGSGPTDTCYDCLFAKGCIDDTVLGDTKHECEDLNGGNSSATFTAGNGHAASYASDCLATLSCILSTGCATTNGGIDNCYCGSGGGSPTACGTSTSGQNGACFTQETNGLTASPNSGSGVLASFTNMSMPSGVANQIIVCSQGTAPPGACPQCLQ
jgi:hypothetical protein